MVKAVKPLFGCCFDQEYEQVKMLPDEKFRRLVGIKRTTFNTMIEILSEENTRKKARGGRKIN